MNLDNGVGHLTYSTLVHPGDTWEEMSARLTEVCASGERRGCPGRAVRRLAAPVGELGASLVNDGRRARPAAKRFLDAQRSVCLHGQRVPVRAVQEHERQGTGLRAGLAHARSARGTPIDVADILAEEIAPDYSTLDPEPHPWVSSRHVTGANVVAAYAEQRAAHRRTPASRSRERTGRTVTLGDGA